MLKRFALSTFIFLALYSVGTAAIYLLFNDHLPNTGELESFEQKRITKVLSADGQHLLNFLEENRELVQPEEIPQPMLYALVSVEDRRFFSHWGVDLRGILRAVMANIKSWNLTAEGASTLTQQLARNLFAKIGSTRASDTLEKTMASYTRKIREQITAVHLERLYTKREILTMYLNTMFFGHRCYGVKSAASYYFDKDLKDLNIAECAMIVGLLKAPTNYSPLNNPDKALRRRNTVLYSMVKAGKLSRRTYNELKIQPIELRRGQRADTYNLGPYFTEYVRLQLQPRFGIGLYRDGLTITTTLDSRLQAIAEKHFAREIGAVQKKVDAYLSRNRRDPDLPEEAQVQAAFVAMDPKTGHILAMIGGRDFNQSKFNRATQALRLPGSAFKPFVYTAAIDNGRFPTDVLEDNAITITEANGEIWDPENYDKKFIGPMTLRDGFKRSRNLISIKLAMEIGPGRIARYARNMGITSQVRPVFSIGVGTSEVHLIDIVSAYCVFPNKGIYIEPTALKKIADKEGNIIFDSVPPRKEVLRPGVAVVMTDMLRSVIDGTGGTGHRVKTYYGFKTNAAGKTGTTNSYADAWFIGFTPHLAAGVWVGIDNPRWRLWPKQTGATAALPLWAQFMKEVYRTVDPYKKRAREEFTYPEDLVSNHPVCQDTYKLATKYCPQQKDDIFINGAPLPIDCPLHGGQRRTAGHRQRF
jgi:penicillin-binding protein 1A